MENDNRELFENEKVLNAVMKLALPSVLGQIILVIYNMSDTLFVGMTNSDAMITAVTVCMPAFMFLSAVSNLFGIGAASAVARALGRKDTSRAENITSFAIWGCISVTALYCAGALVFCDRFIDLLGGTDPLVHAEAVRYMKCAVIAGGLATAVGTLMAHIIRAYGCSVQAGIGTALGGILNIILDPVFMFVILKPGHEVFGAALATAISNAAALVYYIVVILKNRGRFIISAALTRDIFSGSIPAEVIRVGSAAFLMTLFENISYAVLDRLMSVSGTAAQAGIGVAKKVNMLAHCFVRGMSQGVLPLIAYNYASGNRKRMKQVVFTSASVSVGTAFICTAVCLTAAGPLISMFIHTDGDSLRLGISFLRILCLGAPFSAFAYTVISFFQAAGRGARSVILALMRKGVLDIPLMFILQHVLPVYGIVAATPAADIISSAAAAVMFAVFIKKHGSNRYGFAAQ